MADASESRLLAAIELSLVPGAGSLTQSRLWKAHPELDGLFASSDKEIQALGAAPEAAAGIATRRYRSTAEEILDWSRREKCRLLVRGDPAYPALLEEIYDPPLILYCRGNPETLSRPSVAVVGTRRPTYYGLQMAQGLSFDLAKRGVVIVSGLARGIDSAAHRGCLESQGPTIAVLGCGIDVVYPPEHRQLTQRIIENGLLVSEFPPGTSPAPQNFPVRNRIISGLSLGTVIVEASEYSGSLITARLAMEQNREVFAIPGNLTSPQSFGPNFLIKQGAKLVQMWRDIVEELPAELRHAILEREDARPRPEPELALVTPEESKILDMLAYDQAIQFDVVVQKSGMTVSQLSTLLLNLEMQGRVRQVPGNLFVRVAKHDG